MLQARTLTMLVVSTILTSLPAFSQQSVEYRSDATVQAFGSFVKDTTHDGVRHRTTHSGGVLGSYRFFFNRHHGVEMNYGYARNTQSYWLTGSPFGVKANSHEASAAYVLRYPLRRWTPFALAGAGGLMFDPKGVPGADLQARPGFIYGGGADFNLTNRIYFRLQYRGLMYNTPTFNVTGVNTDRLTHRAEPSAGIGFRF